MDEQLKGQIEIKDVIYPGFIKTMVKSLSNDKIYQDLLQAKTKAECIDILLNDLHKKGATHDVMDAGNLKTGERAFIGDTLNEYELSKVEQGACHYTWSEYVDIIADLYEGDYVAGYICESTFVKQMDEEAKEYRFINISLDEIYQHPDNPRKDLGDLSELSESIKKQGVMQNLTVIKGHCINADEWVDTGYTLLIGHRRAAACRLAGLQSVPCRIVERMDHKAQVGIMLEENMQRNDLTVIEQAQGFQMMLDLGDTADDIASKTGFCKSTVRHRLNLAKLDPEELKKKTDENGVYQITLKDLIELEQVEDVAERNRILSNSTNSREVVWKAKQAAENIRTNKKKDIVKKMLSLQGIKEAKSKSSFYGYNNDNWDIVKEIQCEGDKEVPKRINKISGEGLYYLEYFNSVYVVKKHIEVKKEKSEYEIQQEKITNNKKLIKTKLRHLDGVRKGFISKIIDGDIDALDDDMHVVHTIWSIFIKLGVSICESNLIAFYVDKGYYNMSQKEKKDAQNKLKELTIVNSMMLVLEYALEGRDTIDYNGYQNELIIDAMKLTYELLAEYGWTFPDGDYEEIINGTSELYRTEN